MGSDLDKLLADAEALPRPSANGVTRKNPRRHARAFLKDNELVPGIFPAISMAHFFQFYLAWARHLDPPVRLLKPYGFGRSLTRAGFRCRIRATRAMGKDGWLVATSQASAKRLLEWAERHPLTPEQNAPFNAKLRRMHGTATPEGPREVADHGAPESGEGHRQEPDGDLHQDAG